MLSGIDILDRTTVNAWDNPRIVQAVKATGRRKLIIADVSTGVCLAFSAISATADGYDVYAAIDASGTFSEIKRITGMLRMLQAGVIPIDYSTVAVEITADNANPEAMDVYPAIDMPFATLVGQLFGAYTTTLARK